MPFSTRICKKSTEAEQGIVPSYHDMDNIPAESAIESIRSVAVPEPLDSSRRQQGGRTGGVKGYANALCNVRSDVCVT